MCCGLSFFLYPYLERIKFDYSVGNPNNLKKFKKVFYGRIVPGERSNKNRTVALWDSKIYGTFPRMSGSMSHSGRVIEAWEEDILRAFSVWKGGKGAPNMPFGEYTGKGPLGKGPHENEEQSRAAFEEVVEEVGDTGACPEPEPPGPLPSSAARGAGAVRDDREARPPEKTERPPEPRHPPRERNGDEKKDKQAEKKDPPKAPSSVVGSVAKTIGKGKGMGKTPDQERPRETAEAGSSSKQAAVPARPKPKPVEGQTLNNYLVILFLDLNMLGGPQDENTTRFLDLVPVRTMAASMVVGPTARGQYLRDVASTSNGLAGANCYDQPPWTCPKGRAPNGTWAYLGSNYCCLEFCAGEKFKERFVWNYGSLNFWVQDKIQRTMLLETAFLHGCFFEFFFKKKLKETCVRCFFEFFCQKEIERNMCSMFLWIFLPRRNWKKHAFDVSLNFSPRKKLKETCVRCFFEFFFQKKWKKHVFDVSLNFSSRKNERNMYSMFLWIFLPERNWKKHVFNVSLNFSAKKKLKETCVRCFFEFFSQEKIERNMCSMFEFFFQKKWKKHVFDVSLNFSSRKNDWNMCSMFLWIFLPERNWKKHVFNVSLNFSSKKKLKETCVRCFFEFFSQEKIERNMCSMFLWIFLPEKMKETCIRCFFEFFFQKKWLKHVFDVSFIFLPGKIERNIYVSLIFLLQKKMCSMFLWNCLPRRNWKKHAFDVFDISLKSWFFEFFAQCKIQRTISLKLFLCKKYSGSEVVIIPEGGAGALMIHTVIAMIAMKLRGISMIALIAPVVLPMSAKGWATASPARVKKWAGPTKSKTKRGVHNFCVYWLARGRWEINVKLKRVPWKPSSLKIGGIFHERLSEGFVHSVLQTWDFSELDRQRLAEWWSANLPLRLALLLLLLLLCQLMWGAPICHKRCSDLLFKVEGPVLLPWLRRNRVTRAFLEKSWCSRWFSAVWPKEDDLYSQNLNQT